MKRRGDGEGAIWKRRTGEDRIRGEIYKWYYAFSMMEEHYHHPLALAWKKIDVEIRLYSFLYTNSCLYNNYIYYFSHLYAYSQVQ